METKRRAQLHDCCIVPYRRTDSGIEFCLITPVSRNRWGFPSVSILDPSRPDDVPPEQAAKVAGLRGELQGLEPLEIFVAVRGDEERTTAGYLMRVTQIDEEASWSEQTAQRRRWCLAEEARVRIRRKPLRRLIDLALQRIDGREKP